MHWAQLMQATTLEHNDTYHHITTLDHNDGHISTYRILLQYNRMEQTITMIQDPQLWLPFKKVKPTDAFNIFLLIPTKIILTYSA